MSYQKIDKCPLCGHTHFTNTIICADHSVSKESFALVKCNNCSFTFTNPRPDEANIGKYYESEDYISHANKKTNLVNAIYKLVRVYTLNQKRKLIGQYAEKGNLLDYGCGTGNFLSVCKQVQWKVTGIEPNDNARAQAADLLNQKIYPDIKHLQDEKYQAITLWHVLEHIHELDETFNQLIKRLAKNGIIFIAVPNYSSYDGQHYKEHWAGYDVPRHLYHFTQDTMKAWFKKYKLKHIDTLPMKFDAYYVSMLSEKYLNGKPDLLKAFQIGYKSNKWAKNNNTNYSSLIYIAKK